MQIAASASGSLGKCLEQESGRSSLVRGAVTTCFSCTQQTPTEAWMPPEGEGGQSLQSWGCLGVPSDHLLKDYRSKMWDAGVTPPSPRCSRAAAGLGVVAHPSGGSQLAELAVGFVQGAMTPTDSHVLHPALSFPKQRRKAQLRPICKTITAYALKAFLLQQHLKSMR